MKLVDSIILSYRMVPYSIFRSINYFPTIIKKLFQLCSRRRLLQRRVSSQDTQPWKDGHLIMVGSLQRSEPEVSLLASDWSVANNQVNKPSHWFKLTLSSTLAKIEIKQIQLLAFFGGAVTVDLGEYYNIQL